MQVSVSGWPKLPIRTRVVSRTCSTATICALSGCCCTQPRNAPKSIQQQGDQSDCSYVVEMHLHCDYRLRPLERRKTSELKTRDGTIYRRSIKHWLSETINCSESLWLWLLTRLHNKCRFCWFDDVCSLSEMMTNLHGAGWRFWGALSPTYLVDPHYTYRTTAYSKIIHYAAVNSSEGDNCWPYSQI